eukprot:CAMPEP_0176141620 /NCGR_PEP_ID=MMETSP0120_2-20121206/72017_1 /TAXON_ID=160619 /ORGANISM="Kryptoperidinium foliaceum, Strain CCMP 1326" /LENGTH=983 /DNA_ID=CAMNT_0017477767 /DNA_START=74 /DNA_END=3025 /DNA_ORIENTATION=+
MEVSIDRFTAADFPPGALLSVRCGRTRRQAPIHEVYHQPLKFATTLDEISEPLRVDVLAPVATARVVPRGHEERVTVRFKEKPDWDLGLSLRHRTAASDASACGRCSPVAQECRTERVQDAATNARAFLERYRLPQYMQCILKAVLDTRPNDPFAYMCELMQSPYGRSGSFAGPAGLRGERHEAAAAVAGEALGVVAGMPVAPPVPLPGGGDALHGAAAPLAATEGRAAAVAASGEGGGAVCQEPPLAEGRQLPPVESPAAANVGEVGPAAVSPPPRRGLAPAVEVELQCTQAFSTCAAVPSEGMEPLCVAQPGGAHLRDGATKPTLPVEVSAVATDAGESSSVGFGRHPELRERVMEVPQREAPAGMEGPPSPEPPPAAKTDARSFQEVPSAAAPAPSTAPGRAAGPESPESEGGDLVEERRGRSEEVLQPEAPVGGDLVEGLRSRGEKARQPEEPTDMEGPPSPEPLVPSPGIASLQEVDSAAASASPPLDRPSPEDGLPQDEAQPSAACAAPPEVESSAAVDVGERFGAGVGARLELQEKGVEVPQSEAAAGMEGAPSPDATNWREVASNTAPAPPSLGGVAQELAEAADVDVVERLRGRGEEELQPEVPGGMEGPPSPEPPAPSPDATNLQEVASAAAPASPAHNGPPQAHTVPSPGMEREERPPEAQPSAALSAPADVQSLAAADVGDSVGVVVGTCPELREGGADVPPPEAQVSCMSPALSFDASSLREVASAAAPAPPGLDTGGCEPMEESRVRGEEVLKADARALGAMNLQEVESVAVPAPRAGLATALELEEGLPQKEAQLSTASAESMEAPQPHAPAGMERPISPESPAPRDLHEVASAAAPPPPATGSLAQALAPGLEAAEGRPQEEAQPFAARAALAKTGAGAVMAGAQAEAEREAPPAAHPEGPPPRSTSDRQAAHLEGPKESEEFRCLRAELQQVRARFGSLHSEVGDLETLMNSLRAEHKELETRLRK